MPPQKKIQHLRSKNRLLLDKLESHSSRIEAELKSLKRTIRGTAEKSPSNNETRVKNWITRNNSLQVAEVLSSCTKSTNDNISNKYTHNYRGKNRKSTNVECEDENVCRAIETEKSEPMCYPPDKEKRTTYSRLKLIHRRKSGDDGPSQNSKSVHEIISAIDYSPKSTFMKRMKSKCKPYTKEVYSRFSKDTREPTSNFHREKEPVKKKKKRQAKGLRGTPIRKTINSDVINKTDSQIYGNSLCSLCGKMIERQPITCTCDDEGSESEELSNHGVVTKENRDLDRLKNFRRSNWQDCHADSSKCDSIHCCGHHKCNKVYGINDRLFAVPIDWGCENAAHCPSCPHFKCQQSCCANSTEVIVNIPTSLMERSAMAADKEENLKGVKENIPVSKELFKKLKRCVPQNSMALRYQKGVC